MFLQSLPSRERGLKFALDYSVVYCDTSLPSRERGLKFLKLEISFLRNSVAPFAGAWIEIKNFYKNWNTMNRRSLRGSVD